MNSSTLFLTLSAASLEEDEPVAERMWWANSLARGLAGVCCVLIGLVVGAWRRFLFIGYQSVGRRGFPVTRERFSAIS